MTVARPLPEEQKLRLLPEILAKEYQGSNYLRFQYITFLKSFFNLPAVQIHTESRDIMLGAALFIAKLIYDEDWVFSNDGGWLNRGSRLLQKLNTEVGNTTSDRIPQDVQLNVMCKFYNFVETYLELNKSDDFLKGSPWEKNSKKFLEVTIGALQGTLYKQRKDVKSLEEARPVPEQLRLNLQNVESRYRVVSPNGAHAEDAKFIDFLYSYCMKTDAEEKKITQVSDDTRYAMVLYYLMMLESSYKSYSRCTFGLWSEKGTKFHELIAKDTGINLKSTDALKTAEIIPLFAVLLYQLGNIKKDEAFLQAAEAKGYKNVREQLDKVYDGVHSKWVELSQCEKGGLQGKVKHVIKGATKFTMNMAIKGGIGVLIPAALVLAPGATIGTAYAVFFGGQFIGTTAAALFLSLGLPAVASGVLHEAIEASSDKVGDLGAGLMLVPYTVTTGLMKSLSAPKPQGTPARVLQANKPWVETLYLLPPQVFKEERKTAIENTTGIKRQLQRPAPPSQPASLPAISVRK